MNVLNNIKKIFKTIDYFEVGMYTMVASVYAAGAAAFLCAGPLVEILTTEEWGYKLPTLCFYIFNPDIFWHDFFGEGSKPMYP